MTADNAQSHDHAESPALTWQAHPAAQRLGHCILAVGIILLSCSIITFMCITEGLSVPVSLAIGLASLVALGLSLNRFFLGSSFVIDDVGITARYPFRSMQLPWARVQRFMHDARGGFLSTRAHASRFDSFRGMHIIWPADNTERDHIIRAIEKRRACAAAADGPRE
ncbi:MAG: hypothetical protein ACR2GY_10085 [Phycisphaerales bacterium]